MDEDQDGEMSPFVMRAVCKQAGVMDDVMQARLAKLERKHADQLFTNRHYIIDDCQKLLKIIAYVYQVAGVHDVPEHILDVLADPGGATEAQVEAMLPYRRA